MDIFEKVRSSTKKVTEKAQFIKLNFEKLEDLSKRLNPKEIKKFYKYEGDFYYKGEGGIFLNYIVTLNALTFDAGLSKEFKEKIKRKESTFKVVASLLKEQVQQGESLDVNFAKNINSQKLGKMLGVDPAFELIGMYVQSLNELGSFISKSYGSYSNFINSFNAQSRANGIVNSLYENLSFYKDKAEYNGFTVFFLKRAQLLANDIYLAFKGKGYGDIKDINNLTMFADNLIPHFFRIEGVLEYEKDLVQRIEKEEIIPFGSKEEVEIRAFGVQCIEKLRELLNKRNPLIMSSEIDWYLWEKTQHPKYKSIPRHKTPTFFY